MRRRIGLYNFSSQYQQRPIPVSGNLVKRDWLRFYDRDGAPRKYLRIVQSWDTAAKTSELETRVRCEPIAKLLLPDGITVSLGIPQCFQCLAVLPSQNLHRSQEAIADDLVNRLTLDDRLLPQFGAPRRAPVPFAVR